MHTLTLDDNELDTLAAVLIDGAKKYGQQAADAFTNGTVESYRSNRMMRTECYMLLEKVNKLRTGEEDHND